MTPQSPATTAFRATIQLKAFDIFTDPLLEAESRSDGWGVEFVYSNEVGKRVHMANVGRISLGDYAGVGFADFRELKELQAFKRIAFLKHVEVVLDAVLESPKP